MLLSVLRQRLFLFIFCWLSYRFCDSRGFCARIWLNGTATVDDDGPRYYWFWSLYEISVWVFGTFSVCFWKQCAHSSLLVFEFEVWLTDGLQSACKIDGVLRPKCNSRGCLDGLRAIDSNRRRLLRTPESQPPFNAMARCQFDDRLISFLLFLFYLFVILIFLFFRSGKNWLGEVVFGLWLWGFVFLLCSVSTCD